LDFVLFCFSFGFVRVAIIAGQSRRKNADFVVVVILRLILNTFDNNISTNGFDEQRLRLAIVDLSSKSYRPRRRAVDLCRYDVNATTTTTTTTNLC
jgi:hypothetical protein